jgi:hypothetical protein
MEFSFTDSSVVFEFVYGNYTISIADYTRGGRPEGKVSIMILRNGSPLSTKSLERIAAFAGNQIRGVITVSNDVLDLRALDDDQVMYEIINALKFVLPS